MGLLEWLDIEGEHPGKEGTTQEEAPNPENKPLSNHWLTQTAHTWQTAKSQEVKTRRMEELQGFQLLPTAEQTKFGILKPTKLKKLDKHLRVILKP